jgi:hypothetical protein
MKICRALISILDRYKGIDFVVQEQYLHMAHELQRHGCVVTKIIPNI